MGAFCFSRTYKQRNSLCEDKHWTQIVITLRTPRHP
jgi:hypothetical protein